MLLDFSIFESSLLYKFVLSLLLGALVGIEREKRGRGELIEGLRTFMLVCFLGTVSGYFSEIFNNTYISIVAFFSVGILATVGYNIKAYKKKHYGLTTEIAFILTFLFGIMVFYELYFFAIASTVILTLILISKEHLHAFAKNLTKEEVRSAIIFAVLAFVILPILPKYSLDPWGVLNPYRIWLAMVLVLLVSFVAYVALKILGPRYGAAVSAFFGGLVGSTPVTISMSEQARASRKMTHYAAFTIMVACSTMFLRVAALTFALNSDITLAAFTPIILLGLLGYLLSVFKWRRDIRKKFGVKMASPLAFKTALKFASLFILTLFVTRIAQSYFGSSGIYIVSIVSGFADVDAITISLATSTLPPLVITSSILLACLSNTLLKFAIADMIGHKKMAEQLAPYFFITLAAGIIAVSLQLFV